MSKHLVIVESPAKAKTIEKYLGPEYSVKSSFGHIRDLPKKGMSVDIAGGFEPVYEVSSEKKKTVAELKKAAKSAEQVWLASDEDREGEAISWHLCKALGLDEKKTKRIVFHEITKTAILEAIKNPRTIDIDLVHAQQARRILDRIVGYELSPVLWKKVRPKLSAGRVQSVAVRIVVEREREIKAHQATTWFKLEAALTLEDGTELTATLPDKIKEETDARAILEALSKGGLKIADIAKTPGVRSPGAPFTTSTLQQEAARRLGYSPKSTMMLAQRLYEAGHITYMRTDSTNLSKLATDAMSAYIKSSFGEKYHEARVYKTKSSGAQEAHEAIRPTDVATTSAGADDQQKKLYQLIWSRALASQMAKANLEKTSIKIPVPATSYVLEANGEIIVFDGFLRVAAGQVKESLLPAVKSGDPLDVQTASATLNFSRPPARYSEASLVRQLEEMGIGRPSTYAPTISTVQDRGYVLKADVEGQERTTTTLSLGKSGEIHKKDETGPAPTDRNKLIPTDTGNVVTDFLVKHFHSVIDYDFTRLVEGEFDNIAEGKQKWQTMLRNFYDPFHKIVEASDDISRAEASQAREIGTDPKSGKPVTARYGRFGPMVQIGDKDDEEKPRFAGIPEGMHVETITFDEAMQLFTLPRIVGTTDKGEEITASIGRFGPYIKIDSIYVSIKGSDPYTIDEPTSRGLYAEHMKKLAEKFIKVFEADGIQIVNGRFGPYITDGKKNAKIPKDTEPKDITLEQAKELLTAARPSRFTRKRKTK